MTPGLICKQMNVIYDVMKQFTADELIQIGCSTFDIITTEEDMPAMLLFRRQLLFAIECKLTGQWP